ncbi:MAG: type VI secretion system baseplate subunit TssG [Alphaproteobacteria bacterium]|nr:MAG: type VI secretion system baseplate subunit TssG [Alphaproteobacteria bacterium]
MAANERSETGDLDLLGLLAERPQAFHVFQALRIIEAAFAGRPRLGRSRRPAQDAVRLRQSVELAFQSSTVTEFAPPDGDRPGHLSNLFFGLFGPGGPLPLHITEYARDRLRNFDDSTIVGFADIFHHRMTGLLYRAWVSGEPAPSFDRPGDDPFAGYVAAFAGLRGAAFADRDEMPDLAKLHFAGRLAHGPKNEEGLLAILSAFFKVPCRIESFVGSWLTLDAGDRWQLGRPAGLGRSASLGARVWSRQAKFRIRLGPVGLDGYRRLLPGGDSLGRLVAIVRNYAGDALDWDVNIILARGAAPPLKLGRQGQLGWTTWLGESPAEREVDDLYLRPLARAEAA